MFNAFRAPVELALGLAWGVVLGVMSWWLPSPERVCCCLLLLYYCTTI